MASGQPSVENGHRPLLNHVSKVSSSWRSSAAGLPHSAHVSGPSGRSADTVTWPSGQYQAGMRWPHHSWRLTFQSRMFSIQSKKTFSKRGGTILVRPPRTASMARAAIGFTSMNHWVIRRGSTTSSLRWQRPSTRSCGRASTRSPRASRSARIFLRASSRVRPAYAPAFSFMWPSSVITSISGRSWRWPVSKSV